MSWNWCAVSLLYFWSSLSCIVCITGKTSFWRTCNSTVWVLPHCLIRIDNMLRTKRKQPLMASQCPSCVMATPGFRVLSDWISCSSRWFCLFVPWRPSCSRSSLHNPVRNTETHTKHTFFVLLAFFISQDSGVCDCQLSALGTFLGNMDADCLNEPTYLTLHSFLHV